MCFDMWIDTAKLLSVREHYNLPTIRSWRLQKSELLMADIPWRIWRRCSLLAPWRHRNGTITGRISPDILPGKLCRGSVTCADHELYPARIFQLPRTIKVVFSWDFSNNLLRCIQIPSVNKYWKLAPVTASSHFATWRHSPECLFPLSFYAVIKNQRHMIFSKAGVIKRYNKVK